ncbi:MAG: TonB-dependent receptor [Oleispira sp.]
MQAIMIFFSFLVFNSAYAEQVLAPVQITEIQGNDIVNVPIIGHQQQIEREAFANTYLPLDELLEQQAGIDIQSVGGNGQYASPTIRGSTGKQVLIFWDGLLINDLNGGSADIGALGLSSAGKIDIYRGMSPVELSPSAVGGAINIQSQALEDNSGEASLTLGSFETLEWYASHNVSNENSNIYWNINHFESANNFEYLEEKPINSPQKPAFESRKNNAVNNQSILTKGYHQFNNAIRIDASAQLQKNHREISSKINTSQNNAYLEQDSNRVQAAMSYGSIIGDTQFRVSQQYSDELYNDENSNVGVGSQYNVYSTRKNGIALKHELNLGDTSLVLSSAYELERVETDFPHDDILPDNCTSGGKCTTDFTRTSKHIGTRVNTSLSDSISFMLQAARFQFNDKNNSNDPDEVVDNENTSTTYDSGLDYRFKNGSIIYFKVGKQVRPASSSELFGDKGTSKGNAELIAEKSKYTEVGLSYIEDKISFDTSFYHRILDDAITPSVDGRGILSYENASQTEHYGFELTSSINWYRQWNSSFNLTLQDNKIIDHARESFIGNQVGDYSRVHGFFSTSWKWHKLSLTGSHIFQTGGYYNSLNSRPRNTKRNWNLSATWQEQDWLISLEGKNLTSDRARDYPDIPEPGRQLYFKFIYNW